MWPDEEPCVAGDGCTGASIVAVFRPEPSTVLDALEAFLQLLASSVEDAGLESWVERDLTFSQMRVIMILGQAEGPLPINEVAGRMRLSVAATGRNVEQLVKSGMVDRAEDEHDRRVKRVSLSTKGRQQIQELMAVKRGRALEVLRQLEPADHVRLLAALTPILARLGTPGPEREEMTV
jgi:DNA-binding MarR family transcriptional regulator